MPLFFIMRKGSIPEKENAGRSIDFLGYGYSRNNLRLRKGIKKNFAVKWGRVKSRKRRKQIEDAYKGWCMIGRCRHLWKTITGKTMGFKTKGITPPNVDKNGKQILDAPRVTIMEILNLPLSVLDFVANIEVTDPNSHQKMNDRYAILLYVPSLGRKVKVITSSYALKSMLDECEKKEEGGETVFPVDNVCIKKKDIGGGRSAYYFEDLD